MADISQIILPNGNTYNIKDATARAIMTGASSSSDGTSGLVPAPESGDEEKYLCGDGTWSEVDVLPSVTSSDNGKVLKVVEGAWTAAEVAEQASAFTDSSFSIAVSDWTGSSSPYTYTITTGLVNLNTVIWVFWDKSYYDYSPEGVTVTPSAGQVTFSTTAKPFGTITGVIRYANIIPVSEAVEKLLEGKAETRPTDAENVDLDIADTKGNVILRLADGHIQTKKFNSKDADKIIQTTSSADLDVADSSGNVILRLSDGHIQTKNFNSKGLIRSRMEFGAHNGAEYYAPECTIPAYRIAGQQGWEWAWVAGIDFSADGTMYVIHDDTVDRTTDGTGYLNQMTDSQINALHITQTGEGYNLSDFDPSELVIPTFEQVLQQCIRYGMKMVLRLALFPNQYDTAANIAKWDAIVTMLKSYGVQAEDISCYISNLNQAARCREFFGDDVEISTFLGNSGTAQDFVDWFSSRSITGKKAAIISFENATLEAVKLLHSNGIRVYVYKLNPSQADASSCASMGVDIFQNGKTYSFND